MARADIAALPPPSRPHRPGSDGSASMGDPEDDGAAGGGWGSPPAAALRGAAAPAAGKWAAFCESTRKDGHDDAHENAEALECDERFVTAMPERKVPTTPPRPTRDAGG
jgi:hypothetical protein